MSEIKKSEYQTGNVIKSTLETIIQGITGIATSKQSELILSVSTILQKLIAGERLSLFLSEWNNFVEKGKIKKDYQNSEQHKMCLFELLNFLDEDIADEKRFDAIKKIILIAATEKHSKRNEVLPHQYIKIVRKLSSAELLILVTCYNASKKLDWKDNGPLKKQVHEWRAEIVKRSGLVYEEIVNIEVDKLLNKNLLIPSMYSDDSGLRLGTHFRLTKLAIGLIDFMNYYDTEV